MFKSQLLSERDTATGRDMGPQPLMQRKGLMDALALTRMSRATVKGPDFAKKTNRPKHGLRIGLSGSSALRCAAF